MARPSERPLSHHTVYGATTASSKYFVIRDFVLPGDVEHSSQTAHVEGVQLIKLFAVQCPRL